MAEFSELVRIKKRICIKYASSGCIGCPIDHSSGGLCGVISISGYSDNIFTEFEEALLSWAAENPEPVYPMWCEWLADKGVVDVARMPVDYSGGIITEIKPSGKMYERIPAAVAEKLGIKPKEG